MRKGVKKNSLFNPERFNDGPQFALMLSQQLSQIQISTITKQFSQHGLTVLQTQSLDRKRNILFVELSNENTVFQEAQELQIKKNYKLSKSAQLAYQKAQQLQQIAEQQTQSTFGVINDANIPTFNLDQMKQSKQGQMNGHSSEFNYNIISSNTQLQNNANQQNRNSCFTFENSPPQLFSPKSQIRSPARSIYLSKEQAENGQIQTSCPPSPNQSDPLVLFKSQLNSSNINHVFLPKVSKKEGKKLLDSIDPRIYQYEKLKVVSVAMLYEGLDKDGSKQNYKVGLFSPSERLRITYSFMNKIRIKDLRFLEYLMEQEIVTELIPLHDKNAAINENNQSIEDYYGENISSYFEFLDFYQKWLFYPAIFSIVSYLLTSKINSIQEYLNLIYSLFICIWTTLFYIYWQRHETTLQVKWGVFGRKIYKEDRQNQLDYF